MRHLWIGFVLSVTLAAQPQQAPQPGPLGRGKAETARDDERLYERGQKALDSRRWDEALANFGEVAARGGTRADGALYWKAYTQYKLGRSSDALATIEELRTKHSTSRWLDDAKALEAEVRSAQGRPPSPESVDDEELKLLAINSLAHSDPERAIPMLEKLLRSSHAPKLKERALFVLMQTGSAAAREVVVKTAKGAANPDLQLKAVHYLGTMGGRKELEEVYNTTSDPAVKRAVLRGFMVSGAREQLFNVAKGEKDLDLRREAIRQLGVMGSQNELWQLYQAEADAKLKAELLRSFFVGGNAEKLMELAKAEQDAALRREAIRHIGMMGARRTGDGLAALYGSEQDKSIRKEIVNALFIQGNAKALVDIARKEQDSEMKKEIVHRLSMMKSKEATDYMLELLK